jgi:hypothetical protein
VDFELLCSLQVFGESLVVGVSSGRGSAWAAAPAAVASFAPAVFWRRSDTVCWEQHAARALTKKSQAWPPQVAEGPLLRRCCGRLFPHRVSSPRTGRAEPLPLLTRQSSSRASGAHRCGLVFPAPNSLEPRFYPFHVGSFKVSRSPIRDCDAGTDRDRNRTSSAAADPWPRHMRTWEARREKLI